MAHRRKNVRGHNGPRRHDPLVLQSQQLVEKGRSEFQAGLASRRALVHSLYQQGSVGDLFAQMIFNEFVSSRKEGHKSKIQAAIEAAQLSFRSQYPILARDTDGMKTGEQIARDCLRAVRTELHGAESYT